MLIRRSLSLVLPLALGLLGLAFLSDLVRPTADPVVASAPMAGANTWTHYYGTEQTNWTEGVAVGLDGGILVVGRSFWGPDDDTGWAVMHDPEGAIRWATQWGNHHWGDGLTGVALLPGGDFVVGGSFEYDAFVARIAPAGSVLWQRTLSEPMRISHVVAGTGETLGAAGWIQSDLGNGVSLAQFDGAGNLLWQRRLNLNGADYLAATTDGGYVVGQYFHLMRLDSAGNLLWQHKVDSNTIHIKDVVVEPDGAITALMGDGQAVMLVSLDDQGNITRQIGLETGFTLHASDLLRLADGGYLLAGLRELPASEILVTWLIRLDADGDALWGRQLASGALRGLPVEIAETPDGALAVAGTREPVELGQEMDVWVSRLDADGEIERCPRLTAFAVSGTTPSVPLVSGSIQFFDHPDVATPASVPLAPLALQPELICPVPHLTLSKVGPAHVMAMAPLSYTLTLTNNTAVTLTGLLLTDALPAGSAHLQGGLLVGNQVQWQLDELPPKSTAQLQFSVQTARLAVNDDYRLTCSEGYSATGRTIITTTVENRAYVPLTANNYCSPYRDDFDNPGSGWPVVDEADLFTAYEGGEYRVLVSENNGYLILSPACERIDYEVETAVRWAGEPSGSYGLIFDVSADFDWFYLFEVNTDYQQYRLLHVTPGGYESVVGPTYSATINSGLAGNHLLVRREGQTLVLVINGAQLGSWSRPASTAPMGVGLVVSAYSNVDADARFAFFATRPLDSGLTGAPAPATPHRLPAGLGAPSPEAEPAPDCPCQLAQERHCGFGGTESWRIITKQQDACARPL